MEMSEGVSEPAKQDSGDTIQSTSKRVRMIFSVMASPNRIDILRILNAKGPLTYSELKSMAGFKSKKESGKFAYHLRKLLRQSLVSLNKSERRYTITNLGKLVLSLARQIEERSIIESGKMYVRSSGSSIEEFNSHKIIQSLIREAGMPPELAQKVTEEVENKIYKYQTTYLTGSLIRDIANSVLLEHDHEEYRNRLARLGMPLFDVVSMMSGVDKTDNGAEGLLSAAGQRIFSEYLFTNTLPKDVADSHMTGDLHVSSPGVWPLLPDTIFVSAKEMLEDGLDLGGKHLSVSRVPPPKTAEGLDTALSIALSLVSREASREVVIDGLPSVLAKRTKDSAVLEAALTRAFATASTAPKYGGGNDATTVSIRLQLGTENRAISAIMAAYHAYALITPAPRIGLVVDIAKGKASDVSSKAAEIVAAGGLITFARGPVSYAGITNLSRSAAASIKLHSVSINLPRLAFESNKDETYFRARLALLMKPALDAMAARKKDVSDLTRRGLNPMLAKNSQYMQRISVTLVINLAGLSEAVFNILGYDDDKRGRDVLYKVVETAVDVASKKGKELGHEVRVSMVGGDGAERFAVMDGDKYGKNSILDEADPYTYSQGIVLPAAEIGGLTTKSGEVVRCNRLAKILNGGLAVTLDMADGASVKEIKAAIEGAAELVPTFTPSKRVPICGECGFKGVDGQVADKCPSCKSPYIIT